MENNFQNPSKKVYTTPAVKDLGTLNDLTNTTGSGSVDDSGSSGYAYYS